MSKDRIKDLQENTSWPSVSYRRLPRQCQNNEDQIETDHTNSQSTTINIDNESNVIEFLTEVEGIRSVIDKIDVLVQQVKRIQIAMLQPMANSKLGQELDDETETIKKLAYETSTRLKKMKETQENPDNYDKINAEWRIKESQIFVLTRRFRDTMIEYNKETVLHRERCKKVIVRELDISGHRKTNDELEDMLEGGYPGTFNFSLLVDTQKAKQSLDEIEARHRDITKLETSIKELHNMFRDLAILVADQGEMVDSIEHNLSKAINYVEVAAENVNIAEQYDDKIKKKKIIILVILLTSVVFLVIFVLSGYFIEKNIREI